MLIRSRKMFPTPSSLSPDSYIRHCSVDIAEQLRFQDVLANFVVLSRFVSLVILPPDDFLALLAADIPDNVLSCRHISIAGLTSDYVDHGVEQERLAVLTSKVL